jgi:riboflavin kinase/FMN adenylyltransferase
MSADLPRPVRSPAVFAGSEHYAAAGHAPVLTIGNFDGVHRGHQHLLGAVVARARALGAPAAVYTFDPPPRTLLAPSQVPPRIMAWDDRVRLLGELGVAHIVVERFTRAFAQHTAEWFVDEVLGRRLRPVAMVVGHDFRFGRARAGDAALVRRRLPAVPVEPVDALLLGGAVVSSSAVRAAVAAGDLPHATALLGRFHAVRGTVVAGHQRGRKLGFPTANVDTDAPLLPPPGVYAVWARVDGGALRPAVANLGVRPTFGTLGGFSVEVHLLDFSGDLYGHALDVCFVARLREERRFADLDALAEQIRADVRAARAALAPAAG